MKDNIKLIREEITKSYEDSESKKVINMLLNAIEEQGDIIGEFNERLSDIEESPSFIPKYVG